MSENKYPCGLIRDLIPLYRDGVCGEESREIVEEHLRECGDCRELSRRLDDTTIEQTLSAESVSILGKHEKKERRAAVTAGMIVSGILMIPVIVCLICNLALGHALDWFFIVLTALLTTASVIVVPLMARERRFSKTVGCFTASLMLLLLTICLYSGGNWFFVTTVPIIFGMSVIFLPFIIRQIPLPPALKNRKALTVILWDVFWLLFMLLTCCLYANGVWFGVAAVPVVFGLSVVILPFLIRQVPLPEFMANHKGLAVMLWDTLWLYLLIIVCGIYGGDGSYWRPALIITSWCALFPWAIFFTARYLKAHPMIKAGIITIVSGLFMSTMNDFVAKVALAESSVKIYGPSVLKANLFDWSNEMINSNVTFLILIGSVVLGIALIAGGVVLKKRK